MNSYYRKIKENNNLDTLEESDDENDFNNESESKYTDLDKMLVFKCKYSKKFRKWIPIEHSIDNVVSTLMLIKNIENHYKIIKIII